jgi:ATP-dependent exoDNAse (exonuclease V) beta subunit
MTLDDARAREIIREHLDETIVVEAAAGTGKTTALVQRMVAVLRAGLTTLEHLVAVTFTDKAAGEMKLRLRSEIERVRASDVSAAERARLEAALEALEVAAISTVHTFCADLLRERPIEAGVDPDFELLGEDEARILRERVFSRWFERALESPHEGLRRFLRRSRRQNPRLELLRAIDELAEHRDHRAPYRRDPDFDRTGEIDELVERIRELAPLEPLVSDRRDPLLPSLRAIARFATELDARERAGGRDYDELEAALTSLRAGRHDWDRNGRGRLAGRQLARKTIVDKRAELKAALDGFAERSGADLAAALAEALEPAIDLYEEAKQRAGALDFLDLLLRMRELVMHDGAVRAELQRRYTHVFVDEFQDTDPVQADVLLLLCATDPGETDPERARVVPGKLFLVGDPKQSIYRFRRADVATYERIKERLLRDGATLVHLTTSFRGLPAIQAVVNEAFAPVMHRSEDGSQTDYVPLGNARNVARAQPSVVALPVPAPYGKKYIARASIEQSEPQAVAAFVAWLLHESGWKIADPTKNGAEVAIEASHVCLLFKQVKRHLVDRTLAYAKELEERSVQHVLVSGASFREREEIGALLALLRAIEWPDDELMVYAALRGPFFAFSDDVLFAHKSEHGRIQPLAPVEAPSAELGHALEILRKLHYGRNKVPIVETIAEVLASVRAHASIAHWTGGEPALANVLRVLHDARRFETAGATSFRAFAEWLEDRVEQGAGTRAPFVEQGVSGVRLMTVHSAKGLEFPVVVLCDQTVRLRREDPSRYVDRKSGLWASPVAGLVPHELRDHREEVLRADEAEGLRVTYVAATRARDLLVVPVVGTSPVEGWLDVLSKAVYPPDVRRRESEPAPGCPELGNDSIASRPFAVEDGVESTVRPGLHRELAGGHGVVWWDPNRLDVGERTRTGFWQSRVLKESPRSATSLAAYREWQEARTIALANGGRPSFVAKTVTALAKEAPVGDPVAVERTDAAREGRPSGKRFGTLVHAALAEVDLGSSAAGSSDGAELVRLHAKLLGATDGEEKAAIEAVERALRHPIFERARAATEVRRETPIAERRPDGSLLEGVIDLAFREGGSWVVVDYKTDEGGSNAAYASQVREYARVVSKATGLACEPMLLLV